MPSLPQHPKTPVTFKGFDYGASICMTQTSPQS